MLDSLLILRFLQLKYWVKQKKQVCMTFDSISGPRQRRSLQKLEIVIGSAFGTVFLSNLSWEESCARVNSVGGFGNCMLIFLTTGGFFFVLKRK